MKMGNLLHIRKLRIFDLHMYRQCLIVRIAKFMHFKATIQFK